MTEQAESTEQAIPMSFYEALQHVRKQIAAHAEEIRATRIKEAVLVKAVEAEQFLHDHEAMIRALDAETSQHTKQRDEAAKALQAEKERVDAMLAVLQKDLAAARKTLESTKAETAEVIDKANRALEKYEEIRAQLAGIATG